MSRIRIFGVALSGLAITLCTNSVPAVQILDYAADAPGIVVTDGQVTSWPDPVHGLVATPVFEYFGPELTSVTINGNNRPALRFDGTDTWMESSGSINVPPVGSMALVMNHTGPLGNYTSRPVGWEDPAQSPTGFSILATLPFQGLYVVARGVGLGDVALEPSLQAEYEIVIATWGPGGTTLSRTNTANVTAQAVNPAPGTILPSPGVSTLHIGGSGLQPPGQPNLFPGDILQVQAYDNQLSAEEITALTASLYQRWFAPPSSQPGDFDSDGDVDGADFVVWQTHFPTSSGATLADGDADGDSDVDGADFVVWQTNFPFTPSPGVAAVPEPHSVVLAAISGLVAAAALRRRKR